MYGTTRFRGFRCCDQCHTELFRFNQLADFGISQFSQKYLANHLLTHLANFYVSFKAPFNGLQNFRKIYILIHMFDSGLLSSKIFHLLQLF